MLWLILHCSDCDLVKSGFITTLSASAQTSSTQTLSILLLRKVKGGQLQRCYEIYWTCEFLVGTQFAAVVKISGWDISQPEMNARKAWAFLGING